MSKVTTKIKRIKKKLDLISDVNDVFVISALNKIDIFVDIIIADINNYIKENSSVRFKK